VQTGLMDVSCNAANAQNVATVMEFTTALITSDQGRMERPGCPVA